MYVSNKRLSIIHILFSLADGTVYAFLKTCTVGFVPFEMADHV
jgi:hypothetical protein